MAMRILAFDHFFQQDLDALALAMPEGWRLHVIPYQRLRRKAARAFTPEAFRGLETPFAEDHDAAWTKYRPIADRFARWLVAAYGPHVFVVPSDTFFYLRPVIDGLGRLGVPTAVVQKETTISPLTMEEHSRSVGGTAPFISRVMSVCSTRQREFWTRAGVPEHQIVV